MRWRVWPGSRSTPPVPVLLLPSSGGGDFVVGLLVVVAAAVCGSGGGGDVGVSSSLVTAPVAGVFISASMRTSRMNF